jgi:hypothetical protein
LGGKRPGGRKEKIKGTEPMVVHEYPADKESGEFGMPKKFWFKDGHQYAVGLYRGLKNHDACK